MTERNFNEKNTMTLFTNWAVSIGVFPVILLLSSFVPKLWLPALLLVFQYFLLARIKRQRSSHTMKCVLIPYVVTRILFIAAMIMVAINIYYMKFINPQEYVIGTANRDIPYISALILAPVTFIVTSWTYLRRNKLSICKECHATYGSAPELGYMGKMHYSELYYQIQVLIGASFIISTYSWIYYSFTYSNVNFNSADRFVYHYSTVILYLSSLIYFWFRYFSLSTFYRKEILSDSQYHSSSTLVRFLILCEDHLFVQLPGKDFDKHGEPAKRIDTPASLFIPFRNHLSPHDVYDLYYRCIGRRESADIRFLYENANNGAEYNILHYLCSVPSRESIQNCGISGRWESSRSLEELSKKEPMSALLYSELSRLYTIAVTSKTYDKDGRRLYGIKHYHPGFRFDDLCNKDVDYNDPTWLYVAENNEDKPFFNLKRIWRKYVNEL